MLRSHDPAIGRIAPQQPIALGVAPVERRRLHDEAGDELRVALRQQHRDRAAHRVADGDRRPELELVEEGGGVVGRILQRERGRAPQPAPVAAVVDADERVAGGQRLVGGDELQVDRRRPAVQQQHDRRFRIGVAVDPGEQLAAALDPHQPSLRQPR